MTYCLVQPVQLADGLANQADWVIGGVRGERTVTGLGDWWGER